MSVDSQSPTVTCPQCKSTLAADGLPSDVLILCAGCHTVFSRIDRAARRTSRKAVFSLIFGCASLLGLFVTGIPAVLLGVWSLRDIRRQPAALKGARLAWGGIATGAVFSLVCGTCVVGITAFAVMEERSTVKTSDPAQVAAIAAKVGRCEFPGIVQPIGAMEVGMIDMRVAIYGTQSRPAGPVIVMMQQMRGASPAQVEQQLRQTVHSERGRGGEFNAQQTEQLTYTIRGQTVAVTRSTGIDAWSGTRYREYTAEIPDPKHVTMVVVVTPDESGVTIEIGPPPSPMVPRATPREKQTTTALSEEEVQRFFESFQ
jgi:hypothetical protein